MLPFVPNSSLVEHWDSAHEWAAVSSKSRDDPCELKLEHYDKSLEDTAFPQEKSMSVTTQKAVLKLSSAGVGMAQIESVCTHSVLRIPLPTQLPTGSTVVAQARDICLSS